MDAPIDEAFLVTMFAESFGEMFMIRFSSTIFALLTKDDLTWESVAACFFARR